MDKLDYQKKKYKHDRDIFCLLRFPSNYIFIRKNAFLFFMIFGFATMVHGQNKPETIFWKVTKAGSDKESFLFGTFHEVSPSFFLSLTDVVSKFQQSDILFVEEHTTTWSDSILSEQPQWNAEKWNAILTKDQKKIFADFVNKAEEPSYYTINPLTLALTTSRLYLMNFCEPDLPLTELMDTHIEKLAIEQGMQVYALDNDQSKILKSASESFSSSQDSLYASYSIHSMENMLNDDLSDCEMITAYKNFEIDYDLDTDVTEASKPLLVERNKNWIQKLDEVLPSNNCFVAVGFAHLLYKQGLIQQLRKLGYQVTPVPIDR